MKQIFKRLSLTDGLHLVCLLTATAACAQPPAKTVHIGLIYPLSTHIIKAEEYSNRFSFHILGGVSKSETGLALSGISNIIKDTARGVQVAGFSNHIRISATGLQLAGFANIYGSAQGLQLAGFSNLSKGETSGVQLSGFINKAGDVKGMQCAGFLNMAQKVKGLQLAGFLNIADSSDYPVGIINLVKNGEKSIGLSSDESLNTIVSFRSGGRVLYGIVGLGYNFKNEPISLCAGSRPGRTHFHCKKNPGQH